MRQHVRWYVLVALTCLLSAATLTARPRKKLHQNEGGFSSYLLSLSYAPDFCAQPTGNKDPRECGPGRRIGFVVHGLWPQSENGRGPENCASARPVAQDIVRATLRYIPTESLIQHEWATHGTCSGLAAGEYFALVRRARDMVKIPNDLEPSGRQLRLNPEEIEARLAAANPLFPRGAFRVSCYRDGQLQEVRLCLNKDLSPRVCGGGPGSCTTGNVLLLPVR